MWTSFMDMHSGGGKKEKWSKIYIQAPEEEARVIFYNRFGHSPDRVTCTCCGEDYSVSESKSEDLYQITGYERGARPLENIDKSIYESKYISWDEPIPDGYRASRYEYKPAKGEVPLDEYIASGDALFIWDYQIKPDERLGSVPSQGYVWVE